MRNTKAAQQGLQQPRNLRFHQFRSDLLGTRSKKFFCGKRNLLNFFNFTIMTPSIALLILSTVLVFTWMSSESSTMKSGLLTKSVLSNGNLSSNGVNFDFELTKDKLFPFMGSSSSSNLSINSSANHSILDGNEIDGTIIGGSGISSRKSRLFPFFPFFTVVNVPNTACRAAGDTPRLGTCHTKTDCYKLGGKISGSCSNGFGVCCVASRTCGQTSYLNNTYFVSPEPGTGSTGGIGTEYFTPGVQPAIRQCQMTVKKSRPDICQMKLEFEAFQLAGPDQVTPGRVGDCTTDMFVAVAGAQSSPVICGSNPGQHLYLSLGSSTDSVQLTVVMGSVSPRWSIRVVQIPCESNYLAPPGCLQFHTGVSGYVKSFNFDGRDRHLNNQRYSVCIRGEEGFCGITWEQTRDFTGVQPVSSGNTGGTTNIQGPPTFQISSVGQTQTGGTTTFIVGTDSAGTQGSAGLCSGAVGQRDFIGISCGSRTGQAFTDPNTNTGTTQQIQDPPVCADKFCGTLFGYASGSTVPQAVTSMVRPFNLMVNFDGSEALVQQGTTSGANIYEPGIGFHLQYTLRSCASGGSALGRKIPELGARTNGTILSFLMEIRHG